ncbi:MAG: hypothetical protein MUC67_04070 [Acidobacteria bacterium]|nr:hypothetical protein [Acidobacteriota bacterium]
MTRRRAVTVPVAGAVWQALLEALDAALGEGRRQALARLAEQEELDASEALRELAAFPARRCAAREPRVGVDPGRCGASAGCPVVDECPLVRDGSSASIARSHTARFVEGLARRHELAAPEGVALSFDALRDALAGLLSRSGRCGPAAPPRARTALVVADLARHRGGPFGATGPFLAAAELEQVAAHVPPGSGRGDRELTRVEAWLRRATAHDAALVELR